jgi:hypothetical protein
MSLSNDRIDQRPLGIPVNGDFFLFRSQGDGVTKKCYVDSIITSGITGNFEWVSNNDPGYAIGNIVTEDGILYQSMINDNLNIRPSLDFTDDPDAVGFSWLRLVQGKTWQPWAASTFIDDVVVVIRQVNLERFLYVLKSGVRPYASTDLDAEIIAGDWLEMETIGTGNAVAAAGTLEIDLFNLVNTQTDYEGGIIGENKTWSMVRETLCKRSCFMFGADADFVQTLPSDWAVAEPNNAMYDSAAHTWQPLATGYYKAEINRKSSGTFNVIIHGPYN